MMIRVVQRQHGGSLLGLVWDLGITLFDSLATVRDERVGFDLREFTPGISWVNSWAVTRVNHYFQELIHMEQWIGVLGGSFYEGWTEYLQYLFALLISGLHETSWMSTLQDNIVGNRCSTSFRLVWDPRITLNFGLVQPIDHRVVMALLEDKQSLGREDCNVPIFGFPLLAVRGDFMSLCQPD
jgi:hypothetical protein